MTTMSNESNNSKESKNSKISNDEVLNAIRKMVKTEDKPKRVYKIENEQRLTTMINRKFQNLPAGLQNTENKKMCVDMVLASHPQLCPDPLRFWLWLNDRAKEMVDRTWDFQATCNRLGVDAEAVAQHLILEGKRTCNSIRLNGLASYGGNIRMFGTKIFDVGAIIKEEGHE